MPMGCRPCPEGQHSWGGLAHDCHGCDGLTCTEVAVDSGAVTVEAPLDLSSLGLASGDQVRVAVSGYTSVTGSAVQATVGVDEQPFEYYLIDTSPPTAGVVFDALPCANAFACMADSSTGEGDVKYVPASRALAAWWNQFEDLESGLATYAVCAGRVPLSCDLYPGEEVSGEQTSIQLRLGARLAHNETACISVSAVNRFGAASETHSSDCVVVDDTPPQTLHVGVGLTAGTHQGGQMSAEIIFGTLTAREDLSQVGIALTRTLYCPTPMLSSVLSYPVLSK